jgi:hypothetical protein
MINSEEDLTAALLRGDKIVGMEALAAFMYWYWKTGKVALVETDRAYPGRVQVVFTYEGTIRYYDTTGKSHEVYGCITPFYDSADPRFIEMKRACENGT